MRINSDDHDGFMYVVWDCDVCRFLQNVRWADDELNEYSVIAGFGDNKIHYKTIKANILIIPEAKLIYINPKENKEQLMMDLTNLVIERINQ